ncbi:sortase, partial [Candidatus Peregrinibacteria bacterium]|nr:sortase [Candidatus Peregrinibacteria bacterium]
AAEPNNSVTNNLITNASGITRAEAVYRVVEYDQRLHERAAWYRSHLPPLPLFHDVPQWDAIAPYLEVAFEEGLIAGNRERLFHPGEALRTEEAQSMIRTLRRGGESEQGGDVIFFVQPIPRENFLAILQDPSSYLPAVALGPRSLGVVGLAKAGPSPSRVGGCGTGQHECSPTRFGFVGQTSAVRWNTANLFVMDLPTLGIHNLPVAHPKDPLSHAGILEPLKNGVGHLFGFPGGGGKVMIYGHSSGYPWDLSEYTRIFRTVNRLEVGDPIDIAYQGQRFTYQVTGKQRVEASDLRPFQEDSEGEELILYTCWPPDSTSERLLVRAKPVRTFVQGLGW